MTDQELLEKAARAAFPYYEEYLKDPDMIRWLERWNPLENDGDAFRLMHTMGLEPMSGETDLDEPIYTIIGLGISYSESPTCDRHDIAGFRRAIVRAAAAMADQA